MFYYTLRRNFYQNRIEVTSVRCMVGCPSIEKFLDTVYAVEALQIIVA
jgi:hypothetical protein